MLAPNLKPNETQRETYEMNSIPTNKGNKAKGQPLGTNSEKNFKPCLFRPNIVAPITIVKLREKVNTKWAVDAKLYGLLVIYAIINKLIYGEETYYK